jgi:hypothetical protein
MAPAAPISTGNGTIGEFIKRPDASFLWNNQRRGRIAVRGTQSAIKTRYGGNRIIGFGRLPGARGRLRRRCVSRHGPYPYPDNFQTHRSRCALAEPSHLLGRCVGHIGDHARRKAELVQISSDQGVPRPARHQLAVALRYVHRVETDRTPGRDQARVPRPTT